MKVLEVLQANLGHAKAKKIQVYSHGKIILSAFALTRLHNGYLRFNLHDYHIVG
jgi:hypothetical protein